MMPERSGEKPSIKPDLFVALMTAAEITGRTPDEMLSQGPDLLYLLHRAKQRGQAFTLVHE